MKTRGATLFQPHKKEIISRTRDPVEKFIEEYHQNSQEYPEAIFYWRDGVSDAQLQHVLQLEVQEIETHANSFIQQKIKDPNFRIKMNCLVLQKRHNTRFYPKKEDFESKKLKNVCGTFNLEPGTVIDDVVTNGNDWMEFYLTAHAVPNGTAKS